VKVKPNYLHEAQEADKREDARRPSKLRQMFMEETDAASKPRRTESPVKEDLKFANLVESSAKLEKPNRQHDDSSQERDDEKKNKKQAAKNTADNLNSETKLEKYESSAGGGNFGGQSNLGSGDVNQLNLNENFAARSILHIQDLERLILTVRSQIALGGRREIVLQLKRSVLEGLRVKITTDDSARVGIQFLAANENVRSQIEKHSTELAGILRGRGINLQSLSTSINSGEDNNSAQTAVALNTIDEDSFDDNTFDQFSADDAKKYRA
jgi:hypothetical protein